MTVRPVTVGATAGRLAIGRPAASRPAAQPPGRPAPGRARVTAVVAKQHPEAASRQPEQHRARPFQVRDAGSAEFFELRQPRGVRLLALPAAAAERRRVGPYLGPRLAQEAPGCGPVQRLQGVVPPRPGGRERTQLVVLGAHPGRQHLVDLAVVCLPSGEQRGVIELGIADHCQQRLRQVVVDMRVHPEQDMAQGRQAALPGRGGEGDRPRPRHRLAAPVRLERVEVQPGECHVPALYPVAVLEGTGPQRRRDGLRRAQVGGVERGPGISGTG